MEFWNFYGFIGMMKLSINIPYFKFNNYFFIYRNQFTPYTLGCCLKFIEKL